MQGVQRSASWITTNKIKKIKEKKTMNMLQWDIFRHLTQEAHLTLV